MTILAQNDTPKEASGEESDAQDTKGSKMTQLICAGQNILLPPDSDHIKNVVSNPHKLL